MTARKHLKQLVRARMAHTGESYTTARRHILRTESLAPPPPSARWHFAGSVPGATALRTLLSHAGLRDPLNGRPYSEAMAFGLAGGIGIGVFAFYYEQEDFSSFFLGGRHLWHDDQLYLTRALELFGLGYEVRETGGASQAASHLAEVLRQGPCVAWVDAAALPHRALPEAWSGGAYHVVTVYAIEGESALIGDLSDEPISIPLAQLARARGRIRKQKNRLLSTTLPTASPGDPAALVRQALRRCADELAEPSMRGARRNFQLEALQTWAQRLASSGRESWSRCFRRGVPFWKGLVSLYDCIENYGTGGGLCRPLFAAFLREGSAAVPELAPLAERYEELGRGWSDLAAAALPAEVPALAAARSLLDEKAEVLTTGAGSEAAGAVWRRLSELEAAAADFPLSEPECADLRAALADRIQALHDAETAALRQVEALAAPRPSSLLASALGCFL